MAKNLVMRIQVIKYRKIFLLFSLFVIILSIALLFTYGLRQGIDFTGGSILEIEYREERPGNEEIIFTLENLDLGGIIVQPVDEKGVILRMRDISEEKHQEILSVLKEQRYLEERRFESIGPVIGIELRQKTQIVVVLSLFLILIYIAFAFSRIQKPIKSWVYGLISIFALFHDILIPLAVFSILGRFYGVEISIPIVTAFLAVVGYSINNTVVVFDRIRENLLKRDLPFEETVNTSINQTLSRQINTSLTTLFVVFAIFFFGGETLKYFSLTLIIGIISGTYSSIFLIGAILVLWRREKSPVK